jgi:tetratricopeptide (TPR) repeat protein
MDCNEAKPLLEDSLTCARQSLVADHPDLAQILSSVGELRFLEGDDEAAEAAQVEALTIRRRNFGDEHTTIANSLSNLALLCTENQRYEEAERLYRQSLEMRRRLYGPKRLEVTYALIGLSRVYLNTERPTEAEELLREATDILDQHAVRNWRWAYARCLLGVALSDQNRLDEAESLLVEGVAGVRTARGDHDRITREVLRYAVAFFESTGQADAGVALADLLRKE